MMPWSLTRSNKSLGHLTVNPHRSDSTFSDRFGSGVAAMLVLASGISWYFLKDNVDSGDEFTYLSESHDPRTVEKINNSDQPIRISLSDGSVITLQPKSGLSFPEIFASDRREVFLVGEARFDVAKDPRKPFLVHSNELVTKVLGTSFSIRAFKNDQDITVKVYSGKSIGAFGQRSLSHSQPTF